MLDWTGRAVRDSGERGSASSSAGRVLACHSQYDSSEHQEREGGTPHRQAFLPNGAGIVLRVLVRAQFR